MGKLSILVLRSAKARTVSSEMASSLRFSALDKLKRRCREPHQP